MFVRCIGTGSSGNSYALYNNNNEILLLDLGLPKREIVKAIDYRVSDVAGCVVSHGHGDHAKSVKEFEDMGIPVWKPYEMSVHVSAECNYMGNFQIKDFALTDKENRFMHTNNDGSECLCYGFLIQCPDMGRMLYITDTELVKWKFKDINHILISCNYDKDLIPQDHPARNHIFRGHMELQTVKEFVKSNNSNVLRNVILCHLSGENSDKDKMVAEVQKVAKCPVYVAEKGKTIELKESRCPF